MSAATTLRYAIIEWTGTADSVTKDVVSSWTNTTFTAGQFFSGTSLTIAGTGSVALSSSTLTDITLSASISSSMNNLIIFFWTDSTQAQTTTLDIGNVFFGQGASAPANFDPPSPDGDLRACQRYYAKVQSPSVGARLFTGICFSTTQVIIGYFYPVAMRAAPTFSSSDPATTWTVVVPSPVALTSFTVVTSPLFASITAFIASGGTNGATGQLRAVDSTAYLSFDARL
jgi:hypothetical protein